MKSELNPRQWALYDLLKQHTEKPLRQEEIAALLPDCYDTGDGSLPFHDTTARIIITNDIRAINNSDVIQKIIISTKRGVKLASREEFEKYINRQFAAIFRKLERTRKKAKKAGLDGQMRLTFGRERETIIAFSDEINQLKAARLAKKLRLVDVVKLMREVDKHFDVPLLSRMENGCCRPTNAQLLKLAEIYGTEPQKLLCDKYTSADIIA